MRHVSLTKAKTKPKTLLGGLEGAPTQYDEIIITATTEKNI